jgi:putative FmdB family regulatory protein
MKYKFKCSNCDETVEHEMKVEEYDSFEAVCEECGEKLARVFESPAVQKGSSSTADSSSSSKAGPVSSGCSGMCAGCMGCS